MPLDLLLLVETADIPTSFALSSFIVPYSFVFLQDLVFFRAIFRIPSGLSQIQRDRNTVPKENAAQNVKLSVPRTRSAATSLASRDAQLFCFT